MATYLYSSVLDHTSTTGFRNWVSEFSTALSNIGLTQTADTGQINISSATVPATNASAGYQIWRFNDAAQSTLPIFIKLEYGTSPYGSTIPTIWMTAGSATDGAGNIGGLSYWARSVTGANSYNPSSTTVNFTSYFCYNAAQGFLGWGWKSGAISGTAGFSSVLIGRSGSVGSVTTSGVTAFVLYPQPNSSSGCYYQNAVNSAGVNTIANISGQYALIPGGAGIQHSSSFSDYQAFLNWTMYPLVEPINWKCSVISSEIPVGTTFSTALVGSTAHTYLSLGQNISNWDASLSSYSCAAMLWE